MNRERIQRLTDALTTVDEPKGNSKFVGHVNQEMNLIVIDHRQLFPQVSKCVGVVDAGTDRALINTGAEYDQIADRLHTAGVDVERRPENDREDS
ncbi:MAG: hypothetical protein ABEN55_09890 [Bradymonadaceae bacterium]